MARILVHSQAQVQVNGKLVTITNDGAACSVRVVIEMHPDFPCIHSFLTKHEARKLASEIVLTANPSGYLEDRPVLITELAEVIRNVARM